MRQFYPQWTGRRDKRGIPLYVYEIGKLDPKKITAYGSATSKSKIKSPKLRLFALYENLTRFIMPLCSSVPRSNPETPVDQSNNIVDISKVGLKQFWSLRNHLQEASTLATAHYPEILDRVFIVGAPSFFPVVWGWIKKWFDPITTSKIFILAEQDVLPTLSSFIKIEDIPKKYGGKLDFEFGKMPNLDPDISQHLSMEPTGDAETFFIASPMRWVDADESGKDDEMTALSVGTLDGEQRKERVAVLHTLSTRVAADANGQAVPPSGPITNGEAAPPNGTAFEGQAPSESHPVSYGHISPQSQPTITHVAPATSPDDQPKAGSGPLQHPLTNGGLANGGLTNGASTNGASTNSSPPESKPQPTTMPPPVQNTTELTKTDFFTPPSDAVEVKQN